MTKGCPSLPVQMQVKVGPLDDLPCYGFPHSELFDSDVSESGSDEDNMPAAVKQNGSFMNTSVAPDASHLQSPASDEDLPANVKTSVALDASLMQSLTSDEDFPAVQSRGNTHGLLDVSLLHYPTHDEDLFAYNADLPTIVNKSKALDASPLRSLKDVENFPVVQGRENMSGVLDVSSWPSNTDDGPFPADLSNGNTSVLLDVSPRPSNTDDGHFPADRSNGNTSVLLDVSPLCYSTYDKDLFAVLNKGNTSVVLDVSRLQSPENAALPACQSNATVIDTSIVWDVSPLQSPFKNVATTLKEIVPRTPAPVVAEKDNESNKKLSVPAWNTFQFTPLWSPSPAPAEQDGRGSIRSADASPFQFREMNSSFGLSPLSCVSISKPTGASLKAGLPQGMAGGSCNAVEIIDLTDSPAYESYPIKKFTFV
ncbi:hypothetical protein L7F22_064545 [Adiantum nelumboides]|nr:hypothetical protein [Adiantum nelumboides]